MYISSNKERCVIIASYMLENNLTVRAVSKRFGISKSTVHKDITQNLKIIHPTLYIRIKALLEKNKQERHIRGGMATRRKYKGNNT